MEDLKELIAEFESDFNKIGRCEGIEEIIVTFIHEAHQIIEIMEQDLIIQTERETESHV